ncbi:unnamed protein product, partial [marine sediment metagenome]
AISLPILKKKYIVKGTNISGKILLNRIGSIMKLVI